MCCQSSKDLSFHIGYTPLTLADDHFFIALSSAELSLVSDQVCEEIQCQVPSRQSIVLQGTDHFWKYNPDDHERVKLYSYFIARGTLHVCRINCLDFFGCEIYERPLSRQEAKCCLYSLVKELIRVLEHHHDTENVAHLDVRLENICFQSPNTVVMIDLDKHMQADKPACLSQTYESSVMYQGQLG